jgi:hypothetical protein
MPDARGDAGAPAHHDVAPDWVCEILSPRTEATDRSKKMRIYRREGVGHAWLVNPTTRTLEVYRLQSGATPRAPRAASRRPARRAGSAEDQGGEICVSSRGRPPRVLA